MLVNSGGEVLRAGEVPRGGEAPRAGEALRPATSAGRPLGEVAVTTGSP